MVEDKERTEHLEFDQDIETMIEELINRSKEDLTQEELFEMCEQLKRVTITKDEGVAWDTDFKGRNTHAKIFISDDREINWDANRKTTSDEFNSLLGEVFDHLKGQGNLFTNKGTVIAKNPEVPSIEVEVISDSAHHQMFVLNMLREYPTTEEELSQLNRDLQITIIHAPDFRVDPEEYDMPAEARGAGIFIDLETGTIIIVGTLYAGEIKKAIFTMLNYYLVGQGYLPMHGSAAVFDTDPGMKTVAFVGLSGTGKSTLSAGSKTGLSSIKIADDEFFWGERLVNLEGGSYFKVKDLDEESQPSIDRAVRQKYSTLENVAINDNGEPEYSNPDTHSNSRASVSDENVPNQLQEGIGGHPDHLILLTFDAFGVLPPISRLTIDQAIYWFLQGYTSKVSGTEEGLGDEPQITFSMGFGEPFFPHPPEVYAELLRKQLETHGTHVWLINTGYHRDPDLNRDRVKLEHTQALIDAAVSGQLDNVEFKENVLGLMAPLTIPGASTELIEILNPAKSWDDHQKYKNQTRTLAGIFEENFKNKYSDIGDEALRVEAARVIAQGMMGMN